jgi:hypothetical protein
VHDAVRSLFSIMEPLSAAVIESDNVDGIIRAALLRDSNTTRIRVRFFHHSLYIPSVLLFAR